MSNMLFKKSKYNVVMKNIIPDNFVIYNTFYNSLSILDKSEFIQYKSGDYINEELFNELVNQKILVEKTVQEFRAVKSIFEKNKQFADRTFSIRILTTRACNAKCFYCFESQNPSFLTNSEILPLVDFVKSKSINCKRISICWFGGEPLLNTSIIDEFYKIIENDDYYKTKKITSSIITNGSLINEEIIEKMSRSWKIQDIQITFDGDEHEHNKRKNYPKGFNGFQKTIENLKKLIDANCFQIHVRLNYDMNNYNSVIQLIGELRKQLPISANVDIYPYPIFDTVDSAKGYNITKLDALINQALSNHELKHKKIAKLRKCQCFATSNNGYVVDSNCDIYRCSMVLDDERQILGNLHNGLILKSNDDWSIRDFPLKCKRCKYFPICLGGCRAKYLASSEPFCSVHKFTLENQIKYYILEEVQHEKDTGS